MTPEQIKESIRTAFASVEKPPYWRIADSNEGDEPERLRQEFAKVPAWDSLTPAFLDKTPGGYGSALSFFSDEAFRYYLPAYLIADLEKSLKCANPVFQLTHGLDDSSALKRVNPRRYGDRTFDDLARHRFSLFTLQQCAAIGTYLQYKAAKDTFSASPIQSALNNYWLGRASSHR
ncbi:MAG: DUF6714 family protein [Cyanobacteria bacterium J06560_2]